MTIKQRTIRACRAATAAAKPTPRRTEETVVGFGSPSTSSGRGCQVTAACYQRVSADAWSGGDPADGHHVESGGLVEAAEAVFCDGFVPRFVVAMAQNRRKLADFTSANTGLVENWTVVVKREPGIIGIENCGKSGAESGLRVGQAGEEGVELRRDASAEEAGGSNWGCASRR